jgi:selenocysteine-specific elongation factor
LDALDREDPAQALEALQTSLPAGIDLGWFGRVFGLSDDHLHKLAQRSGLVILGREPLLGLPRARLEAIEAKILRTLTTFHASAPRELGMEIATLRQQCAADQPLASFMTLLRQIADRKQIVLSGSIARLSNHVATNNRADDVLWQRVCPILDAAGFNGLVVTELASAARTKEPQLRDFLHRKSKTGEVVRVTEERFYLRSTLARFAAIVDEVSRSGQEGKFTAAQVRDRTDIGRTRVIEILECFDSLGITLRAGDLRSLRRDFVLMLGAPPAGDPLEPRSSAR